MTTKADLFADRRRREDREDQAKREKEKYEASLRERWAAKDLVRAQTCLAGDLGDALKRWDATGYRRVWLESYRAWSDRSTQENGEHRYTQEIYSETFKLDFHPHPDSPATQALLDVLIAGGFEARVVTEEHANYRHVTTADGDDTVPEPGTHLEHYLYINWG